MKAFHVLTIAGLLAAVACNKPKSTVDDSGPGTAMDTGSMRGMSGMGGSGMMATMPAHMDSMKKMDARQMTAVMARHQRVMAQVMDQMGGEMRRMNMAETPEWSALTDSVRQDLAELPGLRGQALTARMQAHADRVERLIAEHEKMMKGMH